MEDPSILVTGSSGMIGTAFSRELLDRGYNVIGLDLVGNPWSKLIDENTIQTDLREPIQAISPSGIDMVVHLAANSRVPSSIEHPSEAVDNIEMTKNVLEYVRQTRGSRLMFVSSREVYGQLADQPTAEDQILLNAVQNPYGASKVGGEALVSAYDTSYDIASTSIRLSNVYGRYDTSDRVVPTFISRAFRDDDLVVYDDDKILDLLYLDDCVRGLFAALEHFDSISGQAINLGSGTGTSLVDLASSIIGITNSNSDIIIESSREGEVSRFEADISKSERLLNYKPEFDLKEGLTRTIKWYDNCDQPFGDDTTQS